MINIFFGLELSEAQEFIISLTISQDKCVLVCSDINKVIESINSYEVDYQYFITGDDTLTLYIR